MEIEVRGWGEEDLAEMTAIWNEVVEEGEAFPQEKPMSLAEAREFFGSQSFTGVASQEGQILGLYILHPNNVGRCGHIANASYAVKSGLRGRHIGEQLVRDCLRKAKELGYRILQFNAVVETNASAIHLYEKLGFIRLGTIREGFLKKDGTYENIILFYFMLYSEH